jgi:hypothetical protein
MKRHAVALLAVAASTACAIEPKKQRLFEETSAPKTASRDWNGEEIAIENVGLDPEDELDGIVVTVSPSATTRRRSSSRRARPASSCAAAAARHTERRGPTTPAAGPCA